MRLLKKSVGRKMAVDLRHLRAALRENRRGSTTPDPFGETPGYWYLIRSGLSNDNYWDTDLAYNHANTLDVNQDEQNEINILADAMQDNDRGAIENMTDLDVDVPHGGDYVNDQEYKQNRDRAIRTVRKPFLAEDEKKKREGKALRNKMAVDREALKDAVESYKKVRGHPIAGKVARHVTERRYPVDDRYDDDDLNTELEELAAGVGYHRLRSKEPGMSADTASRKIISDDNRDYGLVHPPKNIAYEDADDTLDEYLKVTKQESKNNLAKMLVTQQRQIKGLFGLVKALKRKMAVDKVSLDNVLGDYERIEEGHADSGVSDPEYWARQDALSLMSRDMSKNGNHGEDYNDTMRKFREILRKRRNQ